MTYINLEKQAKQIPEMGGRRMGPHLRNYAKQASPNTAIVELGPWLGAGTAEMALGLLEREDDHGISVYCYDNFQTSPASVRKAARQGIALEEGQDTLPIVQNFLEPFHIDITLIKGMLTEDTRPPEKPISVYVDDATKYPHTFLHCVKAFGPCWIPGETIVVLMDYWNWKSPKHTDKKRKQLRCQFEFVEQNQHAFRELPQVRDKSSAAFVYEGGLDFTKLYAPPFPRKQKNSKGEDNS